jgi:CheY-like chemotaxis protein
VESRRDDRADGAAAWRYLQAVSVPTLAILDWMMPEVDGSDVCRRVSQQMPLANMYLMLLTAHTLKGAAAYLSAGFVVDASADLEMMGLQGRVTEAAAGLERRDAAVAQLIPELRSLLN